MARIEFSIPMTRLTGSGFAALAGSAINSAECPADVNTQAICGPLWLPPQFDRSAPCRLRFLIARGIGLADNGKQVEFTATARGRRNGGTTALIQRFFSYNPEDDWSANDPREIEVFNGGAECFPASTFENEDLVGIVIERSGSSSEDTYARSIIIHGAVRLTGQSRCGVTCCANP